MWRSAPVAAILISFAASSLLFPAATASSNGPPPAKTGGFGEMTCHECHWENEVNEPPGTLVLTGVPETYTPGAAYMITVSVSHPETKRAGFELSARVDGSTEPGSAAGTLRARDSLTQVMEDQGVGYISQTDEGSKAVDRQQGKWTFEWTAPSAPSPVVFNVAANAANGDASPLGDHIYTAAVTTTAGAR
jgi:hypothetical protein